ncbi:galactose mutarotase [Candidatus Bipolaricaulota bacterium]|nr:galactose mutarotase [Candidatus Bipolaricaulota bacterium]
MIESRRWGEHNGEPIALYRLTNDQEAALEVTDYGGRVTSLKVPDPEGEPIDVVLGFDDLESYLEDEYYFGAIVGRYANRIEGGKFSLDGSSYQLTRNEGDHHLHGGQFGFDKRVWRAKPEETDRGPAVVMFYHSEDGEEGYPGNLRVRATYLLTDENEFQFTFEATTDRPTIVNISQHNYYNLSGMNNKINDYRLTVNAERFTPVDSEGIPFGKTKSVEGTPFDFREPRRIGIGLGKKSHQLEYGEGYDHNFVLEEGPGPAAEIISPTSGVSLELKTDRPGLQVYSGNYLEEGLTGKSGATYGPRAGLCLEPGNFPNAPNQENFPDPVIRPGEQYETRTVIEFRAE